MKVPFSPDKRSWHPSVLPGQIVLVSTVDSGGRPNVAPKSWISSGRGRWSTCTARNGCALRA